MYNIDDYHYDRNKMELLEGISYIKKVIPTIFMLYYSLRDLPESTSVTQHHIDHVKNAKIKLKEAIFWLAQDPKFIWKKISNEEKEEILQTSLFRIEKLVRATIKDDYDPLDPYDKVVIKNLLEELI